MGLADVVCREGGLREVYDRGLRERSRVSEHDKENFQFQPHTRFPRP